MERVRPFLVPIHTIFLLRDNGFKKSYIILDIQEFRNISIFAEQINLKKQAWNFV